MPHFAAHSQVPGDRRRAAAFCASRPLAKYGRAVIDAATESPTPGLKRWHAILGTVAGGIIAQGGSLLCMILGLGVLMVTHGRSDAARPLMLPGASIVMIVSVFAGSALLLLVALAIPWLAERRLRNTLGLVAAPGWTYPAAAIGALGLGPVGAVMHAWFKSIAPTLTFGTLDFIDEFVASQSLFVLIPLLVIMPSLSEEIFFRGMLQRALGTSSWAIAGSALAFALFHADPHHVVAVLPIGIFLSWLGARTGSTFVPIFAHLTNNGVAVVASRYVDSPAQPEPVPPTVLAAGCTATIASIAVVWYVTRNRA